MRDLSIIDSSQWTRNAKSRDDLASGVKDWCGYASSTFNDLLIVYGVTY